MQARLLLAGELKKKALDGEERISQTVSWNGEKHKRADQVMKQVLAQLEPSDDDNEARDGLVERVNKFVQCSLTGASIVPFGSYTMNMYTSNSDLDLSLQTNCGNLTRDQKVWYLKRLVASLHQRVGFESVQSIFKATIPIVKFVDQKTGIQCDVSVDNDDGILKSTVLASLCSIDTRFRPLCLLLKKWARSHKINDASAGGLSSYCLVLLVVFHLQTCSPPVLPPLSSLIGGVDLSDTTSCVSYVRKRASSLQGFGGRNLDPSSELFRTFFIKMLSVKDLWRQGLSASIFEGNWVAKWTHYTTCICVDDFLDESHNVAKTVKKKAFDEIYRYMERTFYQFQRPELDPDFFKQRVFGGLCLLDSGPEAGAGFPNPLHFQPNKELPLHPKTRRF